MKNLMLFLLILFNISLAAQKSTAEWLYATSNDEYISDAIQINDEQTILIGGTVIDNKTQPLIIALDSNLDYTIPSNNSFPEDSELIQISKISNDIFLFCKRKDSLETLILYKFHSINDVKYLDSSSPGLWNINLRNYDTTGNQLTIIGDGYAGKNSFDRNAFIIEVNTTLNKMSLHEFAIPLNQYGNDLKICEDSSLMLVTAGFPNYGKNFSTEITFIHKNKNITGSYVFPNYFYSNSKIINSDSNSISLTGRINTVKGSNTDQQLFIGNYNLNDTTLIDSVHIGSTLAKELEAYRGVSFNNKNIYYGGISEYDAITYPYSKFPNRYIRASLKTSTS